MQSASDRTTIVGLLSRHRDELRRRFGIARLALFGSAARDQLRADSDNDLLVDFEGSANFDRYVAAADYLEALLGRRVDLVTEKGLRPRARVEVEKDLVRVA